MGLESILRGDLDSDEAFGAMREIAIALNAYIRQNVKG
jgi:hypothetical protein